MKAKEFLLGVVLVSIILVPLVESQKTNLGLILNITKITQGGGSGESKWIDGGDYIYPNSSFADNVLVNGSIQSGAEGKDGNITIYSEQGATDYMTRLLPSTAMSENVFYRMPPSVDELASGIPVISWSSVSGSYVNLYWTSIPAPVIYHVFKNINVPSGTNPIADQATDTLYLTSDNDTIEIKGTATTDTVDFSVNHTTDYKWFGQHTFEHENTSIPHALSEPGRSLATGYRNNGVRPIMAYGSVLFTSNQYCEAWTGASSPPTTRQQIFGPVAAAGFFQFGFFFVVPPSYYYNITCTGGGTLYEWFEVVL